MHSRESEIHFSRWIFAKYEKNWFIIVLQSLVVHACIFAVLYYFKPKFEIGADQNTTAIKVDFSNLKPNSKNLRVAQEKKHKILQQDKKEILADSNPNSKSGFSIPKNTPSNEIKKEANSDSGASLQNSNSNETLNPFLPNSKYFNSLNHPNLDPNTPMETEGGDIPIEGPSLEPRNGPRVVQRYLEKDMSLFQFTQEFRERFGAIWNSEDRILPPTSPLRPGDVVYYKIYIRSDGTMEKYENLTKTTRPNKNYEDSDILFGKVIQQVFPMSVPPKFANKRITLTEVIAIQVVGRNVPVKYSSL